MVSISSQTFLYKTFNQYYAGKSFSAPSIVNFSQREFGFFLLKNRSMLRHVGFRRKEDFQAFLSKNVPSDVYRSGAYYEQPDAEMNQKGWLGADLIFDIDADHISTSCKKIHDKWICNTCNFEGKGITPEECPICNSKKFTAKTWPCESCLDSAKKETIKLVNFLETDFGFSSGEVHTFFSGHRGYHVHVESNAVKTLDAIARKEIADYMTGLCVTLLGNKKKKEFRGLILSDFGWQKRLKLGLQNFLSEKSSIWKWWKQAVKDCPKHRIPMLIVNRFDMPTFCMACCLSRTPSGFTIAELLQNEMKFDHFIFNPQYEQLAIWTFKEMIESNSYNWR